MPGRSAVGIARSRPSQERLRQPEDTAKREADALVDPVTAGIERSAKEGGWTTGEHPFAYRRNDDEDVVPDKREAPVVRRVFSSGRPLEPRVKREMEEHLGHESSHVRVHC
jgi:hypothetical protein